MVVKSKLRGAALVGLVLSALSLFSHFLLALHTGRSIVEYHPPVTIFSWSQGFNNAALPTSSPGYRRLWGPVRPLESLLPHANPRGNYEAPGLRTNGFIFVKIQGAFHEIRNSICDVVAVSRLLNATLVIPELQPTTSNKGVSSAFKSFAYLYNEDQFIVVLEKDVIVVKELPNRFKAAKRRKEIPAFKVSYSASPGFYLETVLPVLKQHSIVELRVSDGGCLQAILPPQLEEYQRLRCRVAFHALLFRQAVQELAMKILHRLQSSGRPFLAYDVGMTLDALAYHGCAELFQDVHTELIQHRRAWMIAHKLIKGELSVDSMKQRPNGSCPLMPEEVGILLRAFGYSSDTVIYVSGGGIFGGQRILIPLQAMFENAVDRTSLSTAKELTSIYGQEALLAGSTDQQPAIKEDIMFEAWKKSGPRPRPLPPPPARPKYSDNINDWWSRVDETVKESETTTMELRTNAHKLLWEAIDYIISIEADAFFSGFDRDGKGRPNFSNLVMGHRLYLYAASKTFRPNRKVVAMLLEEIRDHLYQANQTWLAFVRDRLNRSVIEGLTEASLNSKLISFLSHPVPECSCLRAEHFKSTSHSSNPSTHRYSQVSLGVEHPCPTWMGKSPSPERDMETEEDMGNDDSIPGQFFQWKNVKENGNAEIGTKEDIHLEDPEELEGGEGLDQISLS